MEKTNFKYLYSFKYNDKEYIFLYSKNYPFYFLEYNSNNFDYPDIDIFKEISGKFYSKDNQEELIKDTIEIIRDSNFKEKKNYILIMMVVQLIIILMKVEIDMKKVLIN